MAPIASVRGLFYTYHLAINLVPTQLFTIFIISSLFDISTGMLQKQQQNISRKISESTLFIASFFRFFLFLFSQNAWIFTGLYILMKICAYNLKREIRNNGVKK